MTNPLHLVQCSASTTSLIGNPLLAEPASPPEKPKVKKGFKKAMRKVVYALAPSAPFKKSPLSTPGLAAARTPTQVSKRDANKKDKDQKRLLTLPALHSLNGGKCDKHIASPSLMTLLTPPSRIDIPTPANSMTVRSALRTWSSRTSAGHLEAGMPIHVEDTFNVGLAKEILRATPVKPSTSLQSPETPTPAACVRPIITEEVADSLTALPLAFEEVQVCPLREVFADKMNVEAASPTPHDSGELQELVAVIPKKGSSEAFSGPPDIVIAMEEPMPVIVFAEVLTEVSREASVDQGEIEKIEEKSSSTLTSVLESSISMNDVPREESNVITETHKEIVGIDNECGSGNGGEMTIGLAVVDTVLPESSSKDVPELTTPSEGSSHDATLKDPCGKVVDFLSVEGKTAIIKLIDFDEAKCGLQLQVTEVVDDIHTLKHGQKVSETLCVPYDDEDKTMVEPADFSFTSSRLSEKPEALIKEAILPSTCTSPDAVKDTARAVSSIPTGEDVAKIVGRIFAFASEERADHVPPIPVATPAIPVNDEGVPSLTDELIADLWKVVKLEMEVVNQRRYVLGGLVDFLVGRDSTVPAVDSANVLKPKDASKVLFGCKEMFASLLGSDGFLVQRSACQDAWTRYMSGILAVTELFAPSSPCPPPPPALPCAKLAAPAVLKVKKQVEDVPTELATIPEETRERGMGTLEHGVPAASREDDANVVTQASASLSKVDMVAEEAPKATEDDISPSNPFPPAPTTVPIPSGETSDKLGSDEARFRMSSNTESVTSFPSPLSVSGLLLKHRRTVSEQWRDRREFDGFFGERVTSTLADELTRTEGRHASWISLADDKPWTQRVSQPYFRSKPGQVGGRGKAAGGVRLNCAEKPARVASHTVKTTTGVDGATERRRSKRASVPRSSSN